MNSGVHLVLLFAYSSDDYYEYGLSGESYDSYGELQTHLPTVFTVSVTLLCFISVAIAPC